MEHIIKAEELLEKAELLTQMPGDEERGPLAQMQDSMDRTILFALVAAHASIAQAMFTGNLR